MYCIPYTSGHSLYVALSNGQMFFLHSGGVERDWVGVPRKLYSPGSSGPRCVCVEDPSAAAEDPNLQNYEGCPPHADSCLVA